MEVDGPALGNSLEALARVAAPRGMLGARHGKHPGEPDFTPFT